MSDLGGHILLPGRTPQESMAAVYVILAGAVATALHEHLLSEVADTQQWLDRRTQLLALRASLASAADAAVPPLHALARLPQTQQAVAAQCFLQGSVVHVAAQAAQAALSGLVSNEPTGQSN